MKTACGLDTKNAIWFKYVYKFVVHILQKNL